MILDASQGTLPGRIEADVCIVGAGPAGISMARHWLGTRVRVCLVEAGGYRPQLIHQAECEGTSLGHSRIDLLRSRVRALGGTSHVWGGGCIPLSDTDLERREWVPYSGWPLSADLLRPYYLKACSVFGINPDRLHDGAFVHAGNQYFPILDNTDLQHLHFVRSPVFFGETYRDEFARAPNLQVLLNSRATSLESNRAADHVDTLSVRTVAGQYCVVAAKHFILAGGGIENARLLLLSNTVVPHGLGNDHDLVGRYFMEHPTCRLGVLHATDPEPLIRPYDRTGGVGSTPCFPELCLTERALGEHRLLNARVRPFAVEGVVPAGVRALREIRRAFRSASHDEAMALHGPMLSAQPEVSGIPTSPSTSRSIRAAAMLGLHPAHIIRAWQRKRRGLYPVQPARVDVVGYFEQAPNPDSRVRLGEQLDSMGQRQVVLDWRLTSLDWHTYRVAATIFGSALAQATGGHFRAEAWLTEGGAEQALLYGTAHHMGTTRMATSAREGVVDAHCRVHGLDNLHVAGSSVFPTGGWAFPTFTLVAMGLRLAEHIHAVL